MTASKIPHPEIARRRVSRSRCFQREGFACCGRPSREMRKTPKPHEETEQRRLITSFETRRIDRNSLTAQFGNRVQPGRPRKQALKAIGRGNPAPTSLQPRPKHRSRQALFLSVVKIVSRPEFGKFCRCRRDVTRRYGTRKQATPGSSVGAPTVHGLEAFPNYE